MAFQPAVAHRRRHGLQDETEQAALAESWRWREGVGGGMGVGGGRWWSGAGGEQAGRFGRVDVVASGALTRGERHHQKSLLGWLPNMTWCFLV